MLSLKLGCLSTAIVNSTCLATNQTCVCADESLQSAVGICVSENCTVKNALTTKNATMEYCGEPIRQRSVQYDTFSVVVVIISGLFIVQRFAFKIYAKLELRLDDWFALLASIISIPLTAIAICGVSANGLGRDIWTLTFDQLYDFGKYFLILEILYFTEITILKLAMLFLYLRIFPAASIQRTLWGTIIINSLFGIIFVVITTFVQCRPISYFWKMWDNEHEGTCLNLTAIGYSNACISIALDLWMLAIPLVQIRSLNLSWQRKIGAGAMFFIGSFVTVVSILRLGSLVKFGAHSRNPTWEYVEVTIWSQVEINVGIICTCMPSFRLFIHRLFPRLQSTAERYSSSYDRRNPSAMMESGIRHSGARHIAIVEVDYSRKGSQAAICREPPGLDHIENDDTELVEMDIEVRGSRSL
ncbi:GPCR, PTH11-type [Ilyonectria robusta]|uniref:GPCR, PTH11-type n=1 Tax=Ilyonectria robusta TaxID=1079257 RepID=UPI001E8EACDC|nr:GPCR, PTH11-type [Ilyonectria robusta]KAH8673256.1 GPCR, PTH11-type [Ilyonectria robusta]